MGTNKKETSGIASMSSIPVSKLELANILEDVNNINEYKNNLPLDDFTDSTKTTIRLIVI